VQDHAGAGAGCEIAGTNGARSQMPSSGRVRSLPDRAKVSEVDKDKR